MEGNELRNQKQEEVQKESFFEKAKRKVGESAKKIAKTTKDVAIKAYDNREKIAGTVASTVAVICIIKKGTDTLGLTNKTKYEKTVNQRRYQYYDPRSRRYFELRRPLTYSEEIEIEERRSYGEPVPAILADMGLLKRY